MKIKNVWLKNDQYAGYRIPGMVITKKGTILVYCEARDKGCSDWGIIDILLSRSEDGGKTFSDPIVIAHGTEEYHTANNPVCIVGNDGILHFLYCRDYSIRGGDLFYCTSSDDGLTWSEPVNVMDSSEPERHHVFAFGPGHGICTSGGFLLVPVWMVLKESGMPEDSHHPAVVSTFYSSDNGKKWQLGEIVYPTENCPDPNETQAVETENGEIYMNVRIPGQGYRAGTWSRNGISGWTPLELDKALPDPTCMGSVTAAEYNGQRVIISVNCADQQHRRNLTCRASFDGGRTWTHSMTVDERGAGYADIAVMANGTVCVLYEKFNVEGLENAQYLAQFDIGELIG